MNTDPTDDSRRVLPILEAPRRRRRFRPRRAIEIVLAILLAAVLLVALFVAMPVGAATIR